MILTERGNICSLWSDIENITVNTTGEECSDPGKKHSAVYCTSKGYCIKAEIPSYKIEY